jgi:UDP:flavonoid glycosyltransferase YjiC (YdhE family)
VRDGAVSVQRLRLVKPLHLSWTFWADRAKVVDVRVLISSTPEQSHLSPQMPLALELQRRGHEVLVACSSKLGQYAHQIGIATVAAGLDVDPDRLGADLDIKVPPDITPENIDRWAARAVFVELFAAALAGDLRRIAEDWHPDVMMRDGGEFAAWVVGEAVGVPVVTVTFGRLPEPAYDVDRAGDSLQELRRSQGLEPDPELSTLYAGPVLVPAPGSYADPAVPVLPTVSFVQPMLHDTSRDDRLPAWVANLGSRPAVYVTLGNIFNREDAFRPFLEALADEPLDLIVTVGRSVDRSVFGPLPANVHVEQYVPQSLLLSSVDAVVCHGGFNTVMGALALGRPLVLAPFGADQPVHARRCAALGVGRVVDAQALDPAEIRTATRLVLDDPSYREAAQQIQRDIAASPDIRGTADIVERAGIRK